MPLVSLRFDETQDAFRLHLRGESVGIRLKGITGVDPLGINKGGTAVSSQVSPKEGENPLLYILFLKVKEMSGKIEGKAIPLYTATKPSHSLLPLEEEKAPFQMIGSRKPC